MIAGFGLGAVILGVLGFLIALIIDIGAQQYENYRNGKKQLFTIAICIDAFVFVINAFFGFLLGISIFFAWVLLNR